MKNKIESIDDPPMPKNGERVNSEHGRWSVRRPLDALIWRNFAADQSEIVVVGWVWKQTQSIPYRLDAIVHSIQ